MTRDLAALSVDEIKLFDPTSKDICFICKGSGIITRVSHPFDLHWEEKPDDVQHDCTICYATGWCGHWQSLHPVGSPDPQYRPLTQDYRKPRFIGPRRRSGRIS